MKPTPSASMITTCPHCATNLELDGQTLAVLRSRGAFLCPSCGRPVRLPATPSVTGKTRRAIWKQTNRNLLLLGSAVLLVLGGLVFFLATRHPGATRINEQKVVNKQELNEYFKRLIQDGKTTEKDLEALAAIAPFGDSFVGLTKDPLPWEAAQELARKLGGTILDLAEVGTAREGMAHWLGKAHPDSTGKTTWILDKAIPTGIDSPDCGPLTTLDRPRRAFVFWPGTMPTGWTWSIKPRFDEVLPFEECGLARVRVGKLWGVIDKTGKDVVPPDFDAIAGFSEHGCAKLTKGDKAGLIDNSGKVLAQAEWEDVQDHINGFIPVKRDGKWGYLDATGKLAIPCEWNDAWRFSPEGFAVVTREEKRGYIDRTGKVFIQPEWDGAINFCKEGIGAVRRGGGWALVDTTGKLLCEPEWGFWWQNRRFDLGFIPARRADGCYLLGKDGRTLGKVGDIRCVQAKGGIVIAAEGREKVFVGAGGKELLRFSAERTNPVINPAKEGLMLVTNDAEFGFLGEDGSWKCPMRQGKARDFCGGLAAVSSSRKWGFIDPAGKVVVGEDWDEVRDFHEGCAAVRRGNRWGFVDRNGALLAEPKWERAGDFSCGRAAVSDPLADAVAAGDPELVDLANRTRQGDRSAWEKIRNLSPEQRQKMYQINRMITNYEAARRWQFINKAGEVALELDEDDRVHSYEPRFVEGKLLVFRQNQGRVWLDTEGRRVDSARSVRQAERPGNYQDRHGNVGRVASFHNDFGVMVMAGYNATSQGAPGEFMPHALPPKYGFMDITGKILAKPQWDEARVLSPEWVLIREGAKVGLANASGQVVFEPSWDEVRLLSPEWIWFRVRDKCGLANATGQIIVEPKCNELEVMKVETGSLGADGKQLQLGPFGKPIFSPWILAIIGGKATILQANGKPALPEKLAAARVVDFYGPKHLVITEPVSDREVLWSLYEPATDTKTGFPQASSMLWNWGMSLAGLLWVEGKADSTWRLMDSRGKDLGYSRDETPYGCEIRDGLALLHDEKGAFFIDSKGQRMNAESWEEAGDFAEGRAPVERNGKWGFIDTKGNIVCEPKWDQANPFRRGMAAVRLGNFWGFIDKDGNTAVQPVWDQVMDFRWSPRADSQQPPEAEHAPVSVLGRWAMIDRTGNLLCDPKYTGPILQDGNSFVARCPDYTIELIRRNSEGKWTTIKRDWSTKTYPQIKRVNSDRAWIFRLEHGGSYAPGWALCDAEGKHLTDFQWAEPEYSPNCDEFSGDRILARAPDSRYGILKPDGKELLPARFERIAWVAPGVAAVWSSDEGGLVDSNGNWIFKDNDEIRIARFGSKKSRSTEDQHRQGLVVIEDSPKWGYAKLTFGPPPIADK